MEGRDGVGGGGDGHGEREVTEGKREEVKFGYKMKDAAVGKTSWTRIPCQCEVRNFT